MGAAGHVSCQIDFPRVSCGQQPSSRRPWVQLATFHVRLVSQEFHAGSSLPPDVHGAAGTGFMIGGCWDAYPSCGAVTGSSDYFLHHSEDLKALPLS